MFRRYTELKIALSPGQRVVGLHCFNLNVHKVLVEGVPAEVCVLQQLACACSAFQYCWQGGKGRPRPSLPVDIAASFVQALLRCFIHCGQDLRFCSVLSAEACLCFILCH